MRPAEKINRKMKSRVDKQKDGKLINERRQQNCKREQNVMKSR